MSRRDTLPDDQGWYWVKREGGDCWMMAHVDTNRERVVFFDGEDPDPRDYELEVRTFEHSFSDCEEWYGPLSCPGGEFGSHIVIATEEDHQTAEEYCSAIVIQHADFSHCRDEKHGASITTVGLYSRDRALQLFKMDD